MHVPPGSVQYGSAYGAEAAADLLMDPALWQSMVDQQYRLTTALDRWIEQLEQAHASRTAEGIRAGEAVRAQADRTLLASIGSSPGGARTATRSEEHTSELQSRENLVCRLLLEKQKQQQQ